MKASAHQHHHTSMLSVEDALQRILNVVQVLEPESKPTLEALDQVLAEDVISEIDIPPIDNSAMDGYAIKASSLKGASENYPVVLRVIDTVAAGEIPRCTVTNGTAVRIMTGAPIPEGADTIVPFEDTDEVARRTSGKSLAEIGLKVGAETGAFIRLAGLDIKQGQRALRKGMRLRPPEIGVLASLGRQEINVIRRPEIAIIATGNELAKPGCENGPGQIFDSNSYGIAASVLRYGGIPRLMGIAKDNLDSMTSKLRQGLDADMLITSAGVSKGDYDMVKDVLTSHGKIDFWVVRMRPAKPLAFGVLDGPNGRQIPHLGLPGNPVSAMVAFEQFGRAAIHKMLGKTNYTKPTIKAILDEPIYNTDERRVYARAIVTKRDGIYHARLTGPQDSNLLSSMSRANGLATCPEDQAKKEVGELVDVQMIDWPEEVF